MRRHLGQSMTEFAVGAAVLSLLLLGTLALAGFQEVDRRGVMAARGAAWQESWIAASASHPEAVASMRDAMFRDPAVHDPAGRRAYVADDALAVNAAQGNAEGVAGTTAGLMLAPLRVAGGFLGSGFDISQGRLATGAVSARIDPVTTLPAPFDAMELQLRVPYALLGDAWHAGGGAHVRARASGLVPSNRLSAINDIWGPLSVPVGIVEPSLRHLCLGLIEPDRVPEDRLGPGRTPHAAGCR